MRSQLIKRLKTAEAYIAAIPAPRPPSEEELRAADALRCLMERMSPEHAQLVEQELKMRSEARETSWKSNFLCEVDCCVYQHIRHGRPLEMPAEVAAVYITNPHARSYLDCEDCGYGLPLSWAHPNANPPGEANLSFKPCPLCGGKVGWYSFDFKQKRLAALGEPPA